MLQRLERILARTIKVIWTKTIKYLPFLFKDLDVSDIGICKKLQIHPQSSLDGHAKRIWTNCQEKKLGAKICLPIEMNIKLLFCYVDDISVFFSLIVSYFVCPTHISAVHKEMMVSDLFVIEATAIRRCPCLREY